MADANEKLRIEFNQWAVQGLGEEPESPRMRIAEQTIARMALKPGDRVLDLSCGAGWATRLLAQAVEGGPGIAIGLDIADEMIFRARAAARDLENVLFTVASADQIPWRDEYFERVLSIESFYYYPDQESVLRELYRVLVPGGRAFILISLYKENPHSLRMVNKSKVPVHVRSETEYQEMLRAQGFVEIGIAHIADTAATAGQQSGSPSFMNPEELREFNRIGALLLVARKPGGTEVVK